MSSGSSRARRDLVEEVLAERCSPEVAAFLIARDARPTLDVEAGLAMLDDLAAPLAVVDPGTPPDEQARILRAHLGEGLGFRGDTEDYHAPENSYLDAVLRRRRGIPITLSVLYAAVGRRAGIAVDGVGFPGHFLARVGGEEGVFVDPFHGGRVLEEVDLRNLASRMLGSSERLSPAHLAPVGLRPLVVRMLVNLKHAHERRADHASALVVCDRLVDLTDAPALRRDRGLHALALGADVQAAADLESYLESAPRAPDVAEVEAALARARGRGSIPS